MVDCRLATLSITDPGVCPLSVQFPTFSQNYVWVPFTFDLEGCAVDQYKVTITDLNGLKTIKNFGISAAPTTDSASDIGGYGEHF